MVHTHNGILLNHKKDEILSFTTLRMELDPMMLCETNHAQISILSSSYVEYEEVDPIEVESRMVVTSG
jgi:hypothetical protein